MTENLEIRILQPSDKETLMTFAKVRLAEQVKDPMERELQSWDARWRGEALDHYLPMGWSFGAFAGPAVHGFLMAQPLLFYRGLTQVLWVEHAECLSTAIAETLLEAACKWARDKHLQCVFNNDGQQEIKTTRY